MLHVTNGDSAAQTLRQTTLGGNVLAWRDTLHEGPVPALPRRELLRARAHFLAECGIGSAPAVLASLEQRDAQFLDALHGGDQVVLWFEHDLYDQLQLVDALALPHSATCVPELIVVDSYLGELTADELEALWPSRMPATAESLRTAEDVWAALQAPDPTALADWALRDIEDMPFLAPALTRMLAGAPGAGGRPHAHRTIGARGDRRRGSHTDRSVRRDATARGSAIPRRHLVLPDAVGARGACRGR